MKQQVSPAVVAVVIVLVLAVVGFFLYKGTAGAVGGKAKGEAGNPGPFSPGGVANKAMAKPPSNAGRPTGPPTGVGRPGGNPPGPATSNP